MSALNDNIKNLAGAIGTAVKEAKTLVKQDLVSTNSNLPITLKINNSTASTTASLGFNSSLVFNPSTSTLVVPTISSVTINATDFTASNSFTVSNTSGTSVITGTSINTSKLIISSGTKSITITPETGISGTAEHSKSSDVASYAEKLSFTILHETEVRGTVFTQFVVDEDTGYVTLQYE